MKTKVIYEVKVTTQFKKDYRLAIKRGLDMQLLNGVITMLATGTVLPEKYKDHPLQGRWKGRRECHVLQNWLLVYQKTDTTLVLDLFRTGTHNDIFGNE